MHKTGRRNEQHKPQTVPAKFKPGFLTELDSRTGLAKALRATYQEVVADVGGEEDVSRVKQALIERFCWLEAVLQTLECEMAAGLIDKAKVLGSWIQAVNSLSGLAKTLGIERKARAMPWLQALPQDANGKGTNGSNGNGGYHEGTADHAAELEDK